jgi:hypothetical protein
MLREAAEAPNMGPSGNDFAPWWFNGSDALALAFFRELGSADLLARLDPACKAVTNRCLLVATPTVDLRR